VNDPTPPPAEPADPAEPAPTRPRTARLWVAAAVVGALVVGLAAGIGARPATPEPVVKTKLIEVPAEISDEQHDALIKQGYDQAMAETAAAKQAATDAAAAQAEADAAAAAARGVGPGILVVGTDIQPGLYRTEAGADILDSCYWARLSSLSGDFDSIITNGNATGTTTVEVKASDVAFETTCTWQPA